MAPRQLGQPLSAAEASWKAAFVSRAVERESGGLQLPSIAAFNAACDGGLPHILMNPKTGSRTLGALAHCPVYFARKDPAHLKRKDREYFFHYHSMLYQPCTLATLREPCDRVVSIFDHLSELYHNRAGRQMCKYPFSPACPSHWLHNATSVDRFVTLLAEREIWEEVVGHDTNDTSSSRRHLVVALPQYLWLGNASRVVCTPRLSAEFVRLAVEYGGCASNASACDCIAKAQQTSNSSSNARGDSHKDFAGHEIKNYRPHTKEERTLSRAGCALARQVYWRDAQLWDAMCGD